MNNLHRQMVRDHYPEGATVKGNKLAAGFARPARPVRVAPRRQPGQQVRPFARAR